LKPTYRKPLSVYSVAIIWIILLSFWNPKDARCNTMDVRSVGPSRILSLSKPKLPQVWNVDITGNKTFSDVVLQNVIATEAPTFLQKLKFWKQKGHEFSETEVKKDVIRLERFYHRRGFPNVSVTSKVKKGKPSWKREVSFHIKEGKPIIIDSVDYEIQDKNRYAETIENSRDYHRAQRKQAFQKGKRYQEIMLPEVKGQFITVLKNMGFAFAEVSIATKIDTAQLKADIHIIMKPGSIGYLSHIEVDGEKTVSKKLVIRESGLKVGQRFSQKKLGSAQQTIFNQPIFRFVTIDIPDQPEDSTVNIKINVREHKLRSLEIRGGFGTAEYLRGQVSWTNRNPFGNANNITISGRASFIEQRAGVDYLIPYVVNNKSSFVVSPFFTHRLEPGFELVSSGINNSFVYQHTSNLTTSISYEYTRNNVMQKDININLSDSTQLYDISSLQFAGFYHQNFVGGNSGWIINPYLEFSGLFHTGSFEYEKASLDVRHMIALTPKMDFVFRLNGGLIFSPQKDTLPPSIRYFAGGYGSVRGWYRQQLGPKRPRLNQQGVFKGYAPVGGRVDFSFNLELRHQLDFLIHGLGIAAFVDGGQVWRNFSDVHFFSSNTFSSRIRQINYNGLQFGVGGGFSYRSPIGPVRLDIGYKVNPTYGDLNYYDGVYHGSQTWHRIAFHFSIGDVF